jgi:excisionase family DNA binding protein
MKAATTQTPATLPEAEPWISSKLAARHLGISHITLRRWVKDGRLTPKRTPTGEFRFRRSELDAVLA